jgi:hypothetical protein
MNIDTQPKKTKAARQSIAQWFPQVLCNLINGETVYPTPATPMRLNPHQNRPVISIWLTLALSGISLAAQAANKPVAP